MKTEQTNQNLFRNSRYSEKSNAELLRTKRIVSDENDTKLYIKPDKTKKAERDEYFRMGKRKQYILTPLSRHPYLDTPLSRHPYLDTPLSRHPYLDTPLSRHPYLDTPLSRHPYLDTSLSRHNEKSIFENDSQNTF